MTSSYQHQGTGRDYQKNLLGAWYRRLENAPRDGTPVAYLFISGNIGELLRSFGFELLFPEVNALQCGIKKVSGGMILKAEDLGYSSDVCGYVKNDIGLAATGNRGPFGALPKPDLLVCTYSGCNTYIKWFEALAELYGARLFLLDVPYRRTGETQRQEDLDYVVAQLEQLAAVCAEITSRPYDPDRLSQSLAHSRAAEDLWVRILESARHRPSPFDAFFEAVFFMAPIYVLRGTRECVDYYEAAWKEIEERLRYRIGPVSEERFRVVIEGPPPWPHFRNFWELFKRWGVCCVASTYSKVGGIWDFGLRHDPARPLESLAEYAVNCYTNWDWTLRRQMLDRYAATYQADALVIHSVKSCRAFSVGQADVREYFTKTRGLPTLFVESDLADPRYFAEAQIRNRLDAFFEALEHRRLAAHRPEAARPGA
ncbi:MAG: 2-hydroxyacyl-CoA dehydratase [Acidobacteria bacterium]|nr:2-hydroxyacyl-CoA dehydratase [Acidobacteriota bacterium]